MTTQLSQQEIYNRVQQFKNDPGRAAYIHLISHLMAVAPIEASMRDEKVTIGVREPWQERIDKLLKELEEHENRLKAELGITPDKQ